MTADARLEVVLTGRDEASGAVRSLTESMARLSTQAKALAKLFEGGIGTALSRQLDDLTGRTKALSSGMTEAGEKVAQALKGDTSAARELRDALREVADAQIAVSRGARRSQSGFSSSGRSSGSGSGNGRPRSPGPRSDALRDVRARWAIRERSQAAELRHVSAVRKEREAIERSAMRAGREALRHGRHAARSINHPALESPGHYAALGAAFGAAAAERIISASEAFDTSVTRLKMFAPGLDADAIRRQALSDSITLGVSADKIVDSISKSVRDGVPPAIAEALPKSIAQTAQVMGGDIERLTDSLAEGIQEATSMGWIKDKLDARRFLNLEAGLSTTAGNTSAKTEQFIAAGGLGHGKEMGLDLEKTMAFGAMLNSSGARTGQASARFMGQLSQNIPKMFDYYRSAVQSHKNTEENRAVRSAPGRLGYGSVREMQRRLEEGPEGVLDFATRLQKLDDKTRKLVLQGYHFSEQGGAMLAELGSNGGAKGKAVLARAHELAEQRESNDFLTEKFAEWSKSLAFMIQQMTAGWRAIENEIGDVLKVDLVAPFRDWWIEVSKAIIGGNLRERVHGALMGFVHGLGFEDVAALLKSLSSSVGDFDVAGFARGLGQGIRAVVDDLKWLAGAFNPGTGGLSSETVGKLAAEMFGLSAALHLAAPVVTTIAGIASAFLAMKAVLEGAVIVSELTGITAALKAIVGVELATTAAGLMSFAGALGVIATLVQGLMSAGVLQKFHMPENMSGDEWGKALWGTDKDGKRLDPSLFGWHFLGKPGDGLTKGPHGGLMPLPQSYQGGGSNWRNLMTPASYSSDDATIGDRDRETAAVVNTSRAAQRIADMLDRIVAKGGMVGTSSSLSSIAGFGGGDGEGGGNANLRYGRGVSGGWHSTPGTGSYGNPSKSLLDLIAQSEGAGYNVSWGNGRFLPGGKEQNLTGKSLNEILALGDTMRKQPGARNSSALGRYQLTGSTIRDVMGRLHLTGNEKFDEAMQDRIASKLISDEGPHALQRWEGLKRGTYMSRAQALLRSGSIASQPGAASFNGGAGGAGKAVDLAMSMHGAGERSAQQILGAYMHPGEWCADFVNGALKKAGITGSGSAMAASFSKWGKHVDPGNVQKGDVITEQHGNHVGHVGMATGNVQRDAAGNVTAVEMISGNYGHQVRKNWEKIGIIDDLRRANTPASLAGAIRGHGGGSAPAPHHGPEHQPATSADNSTVIHNTFHLHGTDPKHQTDHILARLEQQKRSRYIDQHIG